MALVMAGCGAHSGDAPGNDTPDAASGSGSADAPAAASCQAPDVLVVLDRTMSMHKRPDGTTPPDTAAGHMESKWYIAVTAVKALTAQLDASIQFGLELFPRDPGGNVCVTLSQRINGIKATNPSCQAADLLVQPAISTGASVAAAIDPETTLLCTSTPIGQSLGDARTHLAAIHDPARAQYVLFVGDGQDTCNSGMVLDNTDALAADGVGTYTVAFDGSGAGIDNALLNDMACAGGTAPGFPAPCTLDVNGHYRATDRNGPALYLTANNASSLSTALGTIGSQVCCGCIL